MNLASPSEFSLYQLATRLNPNLPSLTIGYNTFEALVWSIFDLLIDQPLNPIIWVKLPEGDAWLSELEKYQRQKVARQIYWCSPRKGNTNSSPSFENHPSFTPITPLILETSSHLRQEFFVIVVSEKFASLILAQHTVSNPRDFLGQATPAAGLHLLYSFTPLLTQEILTQVKQLITITDKTPEELLVDSPLPFALPESPESSLLERLLLNQIKQTERVQIESHLVSEAQVTINNLTAIINAKDQILGNLAQELSLPLTNMKTGLRLLESMQSKREQRQRYINLLERECDRYTTLLSGLQEFIQLNQTNFTPLDAHLKLEDLIPGIVSTYQPLAEEKGIMLGYTVPPGFPSVNCPEPWLRQILFNLLNNSLKFTPPQGRVFVQVSLKNDRVEIIVKDTGIGIDSSDLEHIFKSFYRGKNVIGDNATGAGLGLTVVQQLLQRCGGSIAVSSQHGKGSTFTVSLPVYSP